MKYIVEISCLDGSKTHQVHETENDGLIALNQLQIFMESEGEIDGPDGPTEIENARLCAVEASDDNKAIEMVVAGDGREVRSTEAAFVVTRGS